MKKIILIPLLLSTILLVGCESELDRCIKVVSDGFDEGTYQNRRLYKKYEASGYGYVSAFTDLEEKVYACERDRWTKRDKELTEQGLTEDKISDLLNSDLEQEEIIYFCMKDIKTSAKLVCHSQGVY
ncbi:MAG: hypothetical protein P8L74_05350 [Gammaproteobacteria bacterium]|nr:hypothetical protein [Gammaproteobacteria bacterium]